MGVQRITAIALAAALLAGCAQYENKRGVEVTWEEKVTGQLQRGQSTRKEVLALLGIPPSQEMRGRILVEALEVEVPPRVESWEVTSGTAASEVRDPVGPYGAKGVGEISTVPTAAAVANALCRFDGVRRYALPLKRKERT